MTEISHFEWINEADLLTKMRQIRLQGYGQPLIYKNANLTFHLHAHPADLVPAQRYVLKEDFERIEALYRIFLRHGINIFDLKGGLLFWVAGEETPIPLIPPVIEQTAEGVDLICDGMHRVFTAKKLGLNITVIYVTELSADYPYYAYPLPQGWQEVVELETIPSNFIKKAYRDPVNYKALFRNFNEIFPGIQKKRQRSIAV